MSVSKSVRKKFISVLSQLVGRQCVVDRTNEFNIPNLTLIAVDTAKTRMIYQYPEGSTYDKLMTDNGLCIFFHPKKK